MGALIIFINTIDSDTSLELCIWEEYYLFYSNVDFFQSFRIFIVHLHVDLHIAKYCDNKYVNEQSSVWVVMSKRGVS